MIVKWLKELNRARLARRLARKRAVHANPPLPVLPLVASREGAVDLLSLDWPDPADPRWSLVISSGKGENSVLRCLESWTRSAQHLPFEVLILVQEGQATQYRELTNRWTVVEGDARPGAGWNAAVACARGEWIFLLDGDSLLMPGSVDAFREIVSKWPLAGMAGPKVMTAAGALQQAGCLISRDGRIEEIGHAQHPDRPEFNYLRECDFAGPAALLLNKACWEACGGFNEQYAQASYACADLGLRARAAGFKVIYQPQAQVVLFNPVPAGPGLQEASEFVDQALFIQSHAALLQAMSQRGEVTDHKVLLIIDHYVPEPDVDAGSRNILEFIRTFLALGYLVKFWPKDLEASKPYTSRLQAMGVEVIHGPFVYSFLDWIKAHGASLHTILLSRPTVAPDFIRVLRAHTKASLVYYGHDLHFERMQREADVKTDQHIAKAATRMRKIELEIWEDVDMVLYPSQEEIDTVKALAPRTNAHFVPPFQFETFVQRDEPPAGLGLLFVAGFQHAPNVDAACWFAAEVMPLVLRRHPQARLTLAGSNPTEQVVDLGRYPGIEVTGQLSVDQLAEQYQRARVAVVPLRFGAGVKLKVVEAMQQGVPLVTTTTGLQGLPGVEMAVLPTDDAEAMARRISNLLEDDHAWVHSSRMQLQYVARHFSTVAMRRRFETLFSML